MTAHIDELDHLIDALNAGDASPVGCDRRIRRWLGWLMP